MTRRELIALGLLVVAIVVMVLIDRNRVKSGVKPLLAEEEQQLVSVGDIVVGESGSFTQTVSPYYIGGAVPYGFPLPSMLPKAAST